MTTAPALAAQRAYERAGFEVVEERRDCDFEKLIGAPGFSRMTRTLAPWCASAGASETEQS